MSAPLGQRIRKLREERGLSLDQLANKTGVSRAYLWKLEMKPCNPSVGILQSLAEALDVELYELFIPKLQKIDQEVQDIITELWHLKAAVRGLYAHQELDDKVRGTTRCPACGAPLLRRT